MDQEQTRLPEDLPAEPVAPEQDATASQAPFSEEVQSLTFDEIVTDPQTEEPSAKQEEPLSSIPQESSVPQEQAEGNDKPAQQQTQKPKKDKKPKREDKPQKEKKPKKESVIYEYLEPFQRAGIMRKYKHQDHRIFLRLIAVSVLLFFGFFYDTLHGILPEFLQSESHPIAYLIVGDLLCIAALLLAFRPIAASVKGLIEGKLQPALVAVFAYAITAIYHIVAAIAGQIPTVLHASWYLIALCFAAVFAERLELRSELYSFAQMSEDGEKILLQQKDNVCYPVRAGFFSDFYHRVSAYPAQRKQMVWYFGASGVIPLLFLIMTLSMGISPSSAFRCTYLAFLIAMPASFFFFYTLPQYFLSQSAYLDDAMLAGEEAASRLAQTKRVDLTDASVLDAANVQISDLKFYGNFRIDRAMYYLASALTPLQSALSEAAIRGSGGMGYSKDTVLENLEQDGITTVVDQKAHVDFGTADYLRRKYNLPAQPASSPMPQAGTAYLCVDTKIVATMQIRYAVKEDFLSRFVRASAQGMDLVVHTVDPILTESLLQAALPQGTKQRIFLHKRTQMPKPQEQASADAMTTKSDELALLDVILNAKKVKANTATAYLLPTLSMIFSLFLMAVLQNPVIDTTAHLSWVPTVYHALWCGIGVWFVYLNQLRKPK